MVKIVDIDLGSFPLLLAPMENISDHSFRVICKEHGADLLFTEFIASDKFIEKEKGALTKSETFQNERPIAMQIFGGDIDILSEVASQIDKTKADILDINFGCPVKKIVNKGSGAYILKDIALMKRLVKSVVSKSQIPVTVKTRLGWDENSKNIEEVVQVLQDVGISAVTIHARTRKQFYGGEADWTLIGKIKNNPRVHIPIFGNGDIDSVEKCCLYKDRYGVDGIMIGRAAIGNPWIFKQIKHFLSTNEKLSDPSDNERIEVCKKHLISSVRRKGVKVGILEMRPHYKKYLPDNSKFNIIYPKIIRSIDIDEINNLLDLFVK